jgi:hypothetical protein
MTPDTAAPGIAPQTGPDADHVIQTIRRIYQAWAQGDCSSEDALFAISDALDTRDKGVAGDRRLPSECPLSGKFGGR